jgi:hypothetical protein
VFGTWAFKTFNPLSTSVQIRDTNRNQVYGFNRLSTIGVRLKSCIVYRPDSTGSGKIDASWYCDTGDIVPFCSEPTAEQIAKAALLVSPTKKKKKR